MARGRIVGIEDVQKGSQWGVGGKNANVDQKKKPQWGLKLKNGLRRFHKGAPIEFNGNKTR
jgi:hypothetical protein